MGCPKMVLKGNLLEMISNWQISIRYEDNQIMTVSRETATTPKPNQKSDKTSKLNPNSDRKANPTPSTSGSGSKDKDKDKFQSGNQNQKKLDLTDKLGKDGKLTAQEHQ